jgi:inorganic pyrophosphatase
MTADLSSVEVVIEWVAGDAQRYEWDEPTDALRPVVDDRGASPPEHYGCVPRALCPGDNELLDVLLLRDEQPRRPGDRVPARIVGVLRRGDGDHKLVAVDPNRSPVTDITQIEIARLTAMWRWFHRRHLLLGWFGPAEAAAVLDEARQAWQAAHG